MGHGETVLLGGFTVELLFSSGTVRGVNPNYLKDGLEYEFRIRGIPSLVDVS